MKVIVTARMGLFLWLLAIVVAAAVPVTCAVYMAAPPAPPGPCIDKAELRNINQSEWTCAPGARLEVWPTSVATIALMKCVCHPVQMPDAASP